VAHVAEDRIDRALEMTFPASDPPAPGHATGTEPPAQPPSRQARRIGRAEVEAAAAGADRKKRRARGPAPRRSRQSRATPDEVG